MDSYLTLLEQVLREGKRREDRTGVGTYSVFGTQRHFDLQAGFPLLTTKRIHTRSMVHELLWFLQGNTNIAYLQEQRVRIWDEWADANGDLGPIYGKQWRAWPMADGQVVDQLAEVVAAIRRDPYSRRHLISAWNVGELSAMKLPPCHYSFQFYVAEGQLSCHFTMRSVDVFLGLPFNIASYALLTHMVAQQCDLAVGSLVFTGGDTHLYCNHVEQARLQLTRQPYPLPRLRLNPRPSLFDYRYEDIEFEGYQYHPTIAAPIAV